MLWFGGAIQVAGEVRARKAARHATSDWMELELKLEPGPFFRPARLNLGGPGYLGHFLQAAEP